MTSVPFKKIMTSVVILFLAPSSTV